MENEKVDLSRFKPVLPSHKPLSEQSLKAFVLWAASLRETRKRGGAPFIKISREKDITIWFHAGSQAPLFLSLDDDTQTLSLEPLTGAPFSFGDLFAQWFYQWPWAAASIRGRHVMIGSESPLVRMIVEVPMQYLVP